MDIHGVHAPDVVQQSYDAGVTDEFIVPAALEGRPRLDPDTDAAIFFNFRPDRGRQLSEKLGALGVDLTTMTQYRDDFDFPVAFPEHEVQQVMAEVVEAHSLRQLHAAETEKYAHVTYFFNGGVEAPWPGEVRKLVPSPKVATYDLQPEMSADGVTDELVIAIESGKYDFIVANYANPDMVGHTGVWDATIRALATIDACLGRVAAAVERVEAADPDGPGAALLITADHGNADELKDADGKPVTAHSLNPVPLLAMGRQISRRRLQDGVLADVAPTILELAGLPRWEGMTGTSRLDPD
jgi:2,3-bisphosphoglycerate-independent phosphoglycerate mutase